MDGFFATHQSGKFDLRYLLLGGLEHGFYEFPYIGNNQSHLTNIFQRGRSTTNQFKDDGQQLVWPIQPDPAN